MDHASCMWGIQGEYYCCPTVRAVGREDGGNEGDKEGFAAPGACSVSVFVAKSAAECNKKCPTNNRTVRFANNTCSCRKCARCVRQAVVVPAQSSSQCEQACSETQGYTGHSFTQSPKGTECSCNLKRC